MNDLHGLYWTLVMQIPYLIKWPKPADHQWIFTIKTPPLGKQEWACSQCKKSLKIKCIHADNQHAIWHQSSALASKGIWMCVFTAAGRRGQQTFGLRADCLFQVSHLQSREGLIKSGSPSLADEFFIKTICSPWAPTKICKSSINWGLMISMRWSFTAKSSLYTVHWRLSTEPQHTRKHSEGAYTSE